MLFDFRTTLGTIYVDNELPRYAEYRMVFKSLYNNKGLKNTERVIALDRIDVTKSRFSTFTYDFSLNPRLNDITTLDADGYYLVTFQGSEVGSPNWVDLAEYPCKIQTNYSDDEGVQYESDNESNETFTYYRS